MNIQEEPTIGRVKQEETKSKVEETKLDYSNEEGVSLEGFPKFITEMSDGSYKVSMRNGSYYIFKEMYYNELTSASRLAINKETGEVDEDKIFLVLIQRSCISHKITEETMKAMKGSDGMRLRSAINLIYDINAFLSQ